MRRIAVLALGAALAMGAGCKREQRPGEPVKITVTKNGFEPFQVRAWKGVPLTLVVTRTTDETCATEVVLPEYGIDQKLPLNQAVTITFTPTRAGQVRYACAMNMFQGVIDVR